ncbi:hypothetical protein Tco_1011637 [Tanacetum coccineum]
MPLLFTLNTAQESFLYLIYMTLQHATLLYSIQKSLNSITAVHLGRDCLTHHDDVYTRQASLSKAELAYEWLSADLIGYEMESDEQMICVDCRSGHAIGVYDVTGRGTYTVEEARIMWKWVDTSRDVRYDIVLSREEPTERCNVLDVRFGGVGTLVDLFKQGEQITTHILVTTYTERSRFDTSFYDTVSVNRAGISLVLILSLVGSDVGLIRWDIGTNDRVYIEVSGGRIGWVLKVQGGGVRTWVEALRIGSVGSGGGAFVWCTLLLRADSGAVIMRSVMGRWGDVCVWYRSLIGEGAGVYLEFLSVGADGDEDRSTKLTAFGWKKVAVKAAAETKTEENFEETEESDDVVVTAAAGTKTEEKDVDKEEFVDRNNA